MTMKFSCKSSYCYNSKEMFAQCKKATYLAFKGPGPEEQPDDRLELLQQLPAGPACIFYIT